MASPQDQIDSLIRQMANLQDNISKRAKRTEVNTINDTITNEQLQHDQKLEDLEACIEELQNGLLAAKKLLSTHSHS